MTKEKNENVDKKHDLVTEEDFTRLANPKKKHHTQLPDELTFGDENESNLEETLIGMEYDLDPDVEDDYESDYDDDEINPEDLDQDETFPNDPSLHPNP
jgi:hypothetical protein